MKLPPLARLGLLLVLGLSASVGVPAHASDFHSPRTAALGGAGHAGPMLNDAILLNPSFGSFLVDRVSAGGTYTGFDRSTAEGPDVSGKTYQVSLQDGRSPLFEAGVAYTHSSDQSFIHIGAARALAQKLGVGLGSKFHFDADQQNMQTDGTLSVMGAPFQDVQVALVVDNVMGNPELAKIGLNREIVLGTKFNVMDLVLLYIDPHYTPELESSRRYGIEAGAEFVLFSDVFLRVGTFRNAQIPWLRDRGDGWGFGLGWLSPKMSFDLGVSRTSTPVEAQAVNLGATLYL